ncbi:HNH endonuclease [Rothia kristinae]|uniref:HNH endonuclease n=1 Tax=Rothia kristinae TaxID=37923 RepID=UPI0016439665|nr:HNH endonuclease [Rothia kristinae]
MIETTDAQRFASKIVRGPGARDCWIWTGAVGDDGYGRFWTRNTDGAQRMTRAHRFAFEQLVGDPAQLDGVEVCHTCDNPLCVRAEPGPGSHLYAGDRSRNMADRAERGRGNTQHAGQFFRAQTRAERARNSRALRDFVRVNGYDAAAVDELLGRRGPGQLLLF